MMRLTSVRFMNSCQPLDISTAWETGRDLLYRDLYEELLVPEDDDIPLAERVRRINAHCLALGKKNVILVSIHVNAAGNGTKWLNATGWSVFTCSGQTESDSLAEYLC